MKECWPLVSMMLVATVVVSIILIKDANAEEELNDCWSAIDYSQLGHSADDILTVSSDPNDYLGPGEECWYDDDPNSVISKLSAEITAGTAGDKEAVEAAVNWVNDNIPYDMDKYYGIKSEQIDYQFALSPEETLAAGSGVCLDQASLIASLCRSSGVPCRIMTGLNVWMLNGKIQPNNKGAHAWNEAYLGGELVDGEWVGGEWVPVTFPSEGILVATAVQEVR